MLRAAFSIYLMLAVASGPTICCCTSAALLQSVVGRLGGTSESAELVGHCHRHASGRRTSPAADASPPAGSQENSPLKDKCPCREGTVAVELACLKTNLDIKSSQDADSWIWAVEDLRIDADQFLCAAVPSALTEGRPVKDGGEILRAYQHFRC